jgi:hypothetical protein
MNHILIIEIKPLNFVSVATGDLDKMVELGNKEYNEAKWQVVQQVHSHHPFNPQQSKPNTNEQSTH